MFQTIMESSRAYQQHKLKSTSALSQKMDEAVENTDKLFPPKAMVACQGVEGAYSQLACEKLFQRTEHFVFLATFESRLLRRSRRVSASTAFIPLENSTAGSVNKRLRSHDSSTNFYIVRSTRIKVAHSLLAEARRETGGYKGSLLSRAGH